MHKKKVKAISLFSGGLDSILATKLILGQKIDVEGVNFMSVFYSNTIRVKELARSLGIKLKTFNVSEEFFKVLKNPKHGYGSNLNPCIDCHTFMLRQAGQYMRKIKADFLITGEVLGERPMSQNKGALKIVERESDLEGLILRPLSAKLLDVTTPEKEGWVRRYELLNISGRSRRPQIDLAKELGITSYPSPAGGCLLTDPGFSKRMADLMEYKKDFSINDVELLKIGRHFRLSRDTKLMVGRNKEENEKLLKLAKDTDYYFSPTKAKGPDAIGRGRFSKDHILTASGIMARYCDKDLGEEVEIAYRKLPNKKAIDIIIAKSMGEEKLAKFRV